MTASVLVGVITGAAQQYCRKQLFAFLQALTYPGISHMFVTDTDEDLGDLRTRASPLSNQEAVVRTGDAETLRQSFLESGRDALFVLDGTITGPKNLVEALERHGKEIVGATYLDFFKDGEGRDVVAPVAWGFEGPSGRRHLHLLDVRKPRLMKAAALGTGCLLIRRAAAEKLKLADAFPFAEAAHGAGFELWLDTLAQCLHARFPEGDKRNSLLDPRRYRVKVKATLAKKS